MISVMRNELGAMDKAQPKNSALVFLVLGVIGQGGLIAGFSHADEGADVSLGEAFSLGIQSFWKLLGIRFTVWIIGLIIGFVLLVGVIVLGETQHPPQKVSWIQITNSSILQAFARCCT